MVSVAENNRRWWENQVTKLERAVMAAEQVGDSFLARAEGSALQDAREKRAACRRSPMVEIADLATTTTLDDDAVVVLQPAGDVEPVKMTGAAMRTAFAGADGTDGNDGTDGDDGATGATGPTGPSGADASSGARARW